MHKLRSAIELPLPSTLPDATVSARSIEVENQVLALFDQCALGLRRYLTSFGLGADVTEDLRQDVFLALFRHLQLGRPRTNLKGWLFQVGHNLALKQRQKTLKRQQTESGWDAMLAERAVDPAATPEERLAADRRRTCLRAALAGMPERDRRCLYLRAEGLCYRDIARTLQISLGSVAKSLTRAMAVLARADMGFNQ